MTNKHATVSLALAGALAAGNAWKLVPKGTCTTIDTPLGKGSLEPIKQPT